MFKIYLIFVVLLFHGVLSDEPDQCVKYGFEDFDNVFPRDVPGMCTGRTWLWNQGSYENSTIVAPNKESKWFIQASTASGWVCTASFLFPITPGGIVEANIYTETISGSNQLNFRLFQLTDTGTHRQLAAFPTVTSTGWRVISLIARNILTGNPPYQGYIQFTGLSNTGNIMIIDSFRYVPSSMDPEKECIVYEDTSTTPAPTETPTTPMPTTVLTTTTTTTPTDTATTTETTPTTTPTTPITTPPKNLTNYFVEELLDFRKSVRISKKRITKVGDLNELEQPPHGLE